MDETQKPRQSILNVLGLALGAFFTLRYIQTWILSPGPRLDLDILLTAGRRFAEDLPIHVLSDPNEHTKPPLLSPLLLLLSWIPEQWLRTANDLLIGILPWVIWRQWRSASKQETRPSLAALGFALAVFSPIWHAEARLGQYNLLILSLTLSAFHFQAHGRGDLSGALSAFCVLLKPTQLFFVPWVVLQNRTDRSRSSLHFLRGALILAGVLAVAYMLLRSPGALVRDHRDWLSFLPQSTLKHIDRHDNYGIPALLAHLGMPWGSSPLFSLATVALAVFACAKATTHERTFSAIAWMSLAFSPMTWKQNFIVLLPMAITQAEQLSELRSWLGILVLLPIGLLTPYWTGEAFIDIWGYWLGPLWCAGLAVILGRERTLRSGNPDRS